MQRLFAKQFKGLRDSPSEQSESYLPAAMANGSGKTDSAKSTSLRAQLLLVTLLSTRAPIKDYTDIWQSSAQMEDGDLISFRTISARTLKDALLIPFIDINEESFK